MTPDELRAERLRLNTKMVSGDYTHDELRSGKNIRDSIRVQRIDFELRERDERRW